MRTSMTALLLLVVACGSESEPTTLPADTHDALAAETVAAMEAYIKVLEKVIDVESAQANRERVTELGERLKELKARKEALGPLSPEQAEAIEAKYGKRVQALNKRQGKIGMRFTKDPQIKDALNGPEDATSKNPDAD